MGGGTGKTRGGSQLHLPSVQTSTRPPPAAEAPSCVCYASSSAFWTPQQLPEQLPWVETWRSQRRSQQLLAQVLLSWQLPFPSPPALHMLCSNIFKLGCLWLNVPIHCVNLGWGGKGKGGEEGGGVSIPSYAAQLGVDAKCSSKDKHLLHGVNPFMVITFQPSTYVVQCKIKPWQSCWEVSHPPTPGAQYPGWTLSTRLADQLICPLS